jgi:hypothetical protein
MKKEVIKKEALVTSENCCGTDLGYNKPTIACPVCDHRINARDCNYCQKCGVKLRLTVNMQQWANKPKHY